MEAYIVPGWPTIIAGLVIYITEPEPKVLLGLRSAKRAEPNKWCLPTGAGAIRRDISNALAEKTPESLKDPIKVVETLPKRIQSAFFGPAGFASAETQWYVQIPSLEIKRLDPLELTGQLSRTDALIKIYFALKWLTKEDPKPAETEWPFQEVRFFSREELKNIPIAFGCDADLEKVFWPWLL